MPTPKLTPDLIAHAVEGYESQKARIDQKQLAKILSISKSTIREWL